MYPDYNTYIDHSSHAWRSLNYNEDEIQRIVHFKKALKKAQRASKIDIPVNKPLILLNGPELQLFPVQHTWLIVAGSIWARQGGWSTVV